MAAKQPAFIEFFVARGEDVVYPGVHTRAENDSTPVDLNGKTISVKVTRKNGTVIIDKAATLGATFPDGTVVAAAQGGYSWALTSAESNVAAGLCGVDIFIMDNGAKRAIVIGTLKIGNDLRFGTWIS
jgi:hypothetical protein